MPESTRMLLLTDAQGRVIGVPAKGPAGRGGHGIAIAPLPGRAVREVDVPAELADLLHGPDAHAVLSRFVIEPTGAVLREIPVTIRRAHD
jgi:hypothetical protein